MSSESPERRDRDRDRERDRDRDRDRRKKKSQPCSLFVRNLNLKIRVDDLKDLFSKYTKVRDVYIPLDHKTGESRGFAFIEFYSKRYVNFSFEYLVIGF